MRRKRTLRRIAVTQEVYERLTWDKAEFQNKIGGGKWSFSDTIAEYIKIINM